jgi:hypothetical protein
LSELHCSRPLSWSRASMFDCLKQSQLTAGLRRKLDGGCPGVDLRDSVRGLKQTVRGCRTLQLLSRDTVFLPGTKSSTGHA